MVPKFFCVATEGATTDGREISRADIVQMAETYDFATRAARINVEHIKGVDPTGQFGSYGDVLAVRTGNVQVKVGGKDVTRLGLFAQIQPLENLKALNEAKQKLYTSIEMRPNFANTGKTYLLGLGVTDNPASLGTDVLEFCAGKGAASLLAARKSDPESLFTAAQEVTFDFSDGPAQSDGGKTEGGVLDKILSLLTFTSQQPAPVVVPPAAPATPPVTPPATQAPSDQFSAALVAIASGQDQAAVRQTALEQQFATLMAKLEATPSTNFGHRPSATGGNNAERTDC